MGRLMIGWFNVNDLSNSDKSSSFLIMSLGTICDIQMTCSKLALKYAEFLTVVNSTSLNNRPNNKKIGPITSHPPTEGGMGEQTLLEFDLTFVDVLLHKLEQAY